MHVQHVVARFGRDREGVVERDPLAASTALCGILTASVVDEYMPHLPRGDSEEMCPILRRGASGIDHAQVCFVDEGGGLKQMTFAFARHASRGKPPKFLLDEGYQGVERFAISARPRIQQLRD